jgi:hypothetical protein
MTTHFESDIDEIKAFYLRGDLLRPEFGHWDACDPVCQCIFDLVEAQTEIADAIDDYANYGGGDAAIEAAVRKRYAAAVKLIDALEDRESWPEALR